MNTLEDEPTELDEEIEETDTGAEPSEQAEEETEGAADEKPVVAAETPQAQPVSNIIRGLADSLDKGGTLLLAIAKLQSEEILVTIQPSLPKDGGAAAIPIQAKGSPEEIDAELVKALELYVPSRKLLLQTAADIAAQSAAAATKAKEAAAKRAADARPKPKTGFLTVKLTPKDAKLTVKDSADKEHTVVTGKRNPLPIGKYTITASKDEYETKTETTTISNTAAQTVEIKLELGAPALF